MNDDNKLILFKKNIFNFQFNVDIKNVTYLKKINLEILDIKRYFKIKKSPYTSEKFKSITKFAININHAMFIKLIKNLEIQFGNNILIIYQNDINLKAFQQFFLLNNKFKLLNNIYIKENYSENYINKIIKTNKFKPNIKYDFIIFDLKNMGKKNIYDLEYEYINFLFNCIKLINKNLNKNGSILLLFRYFYLEQVIDYIRLISYYFTNCRIYDFMITEIDDLFYIHFENYNGNRINLKKKYFKFLNKVEKEEIDKLIVIMKNRYYLHKKILYYNCNNIFKQDIKQKKEISLLKSIGYKDSDISILTKRKYYNFLYYLKENDSIKIYNFDKNINIPLYINKEKVEEEINCRYIKSILPISLINDNKKYDFIDSKQRFYKHTLKYLVNEKLNVNYIEREWCKALGMYYYIFKDKKIKIRSYHLDEYPGNFVRALQYYTDKNFIILENWKAQYMLKENTIQYPSKFSKNTSNHWDFGPNKNGDILSSKNKKFYIDSIKKFNPNFMTADAGHFTFKNNQISIELIKSEIFIILNSLALKGSCLIKLYLPSLECKDDVQCLYESFEQIFFFKSELNKNLPEYYVYCKNLKKRILKIDKKDHIFDNFYFLYLFKLLNVFEKQLNIQIFMYEYYDTFIDKNIKIINKIINEKNKAWIDKHI